MEQGQQHMRLAQALSAELGDEFTVRPLLTSAIEVQAAHDPDHVLVFAAHEHASEPVGAVAAYVRRRLCDGGATS